MSDTVAGTRDDSPQTRSSGSRVMWTILAIMAGVMMAGTWLQSAGWFSRDGRETAAKGASLAYLELDPLVGAERVVLKEDTAGQVTLLHYWGTWCPPCRQEFPGLVELYDKYRDVDGFLMLAVSSPGSSDTSNEQLARETAEFLDAHNTDMPMYADTTQLTLEALDGAIGFEGFPTTVIFDRQGTVQGVWVGYSPTGVEEMGALIEELL